MMPQMPTIRMSFVDNSVNTYNAAPLLMFPQVMSVKAPDFNELMNIRGRVYPQFSPACQQSLWGERFHPAALSVTLRVEHTSELITVTSRLPVGDTCTNRTKTKDTK